MIRAIYHPWQTVSNAITDTDLGRSHDVIEFHLALSVLDAAFNCAACFATMK